MGLTIEVWAESAYRSHELIDQLSHLLDIFDGVGGHFRQNNPVLAHNLRQVAALATRFADHVDEQEQEWERQDQEAEERGAWLRSLAQRFTTAEELFGPLDLGNLVRQEGADRCICGCKYWENDRCIDCGGTEPQPEEDA
jgi:hypothetical protein